MGEPLVTLYKRNSNGKLQQWRIYTKGNSYFVEEGVVGGKLTTSGAHTCEAKNAGKANATTAADQALKEATAKWTKKQTLGYSTDVKAVDSTGYKEPMLAKKFEDYRSEIEYPAWVDEKLNGMRCNITVTGAKSRKGKKVHTIPHILEALAPLFKKHPDLFLDGELYNPRYKNNLNRLIQLTSVGILPKDLDDPLLSESREVVQFHVYDGFGACIKATDAFVTRREALRALLQGIPHVYVLKSKECRNEADIREEFTRTKKERSEGLMVRWGKCEYVFKRSKHLLKLKNFTSEEFEILDVEQGNGDWKNACKRVILRLHKPTKDRDGNSITSFASNIDGSLPQLEKMWVERKQVIGKMATVEFQEYSEWGVPLIPWVRCIRDYE